MQKRTEKNPKRKKLSKEESDNVPSRCDKMAIRHSYFFLMGLWGLVTLVFYKVTIMLLQLDHLFILH